MEYRDTDIKFSKQAGIGVTVPVGTDSSQAITMNSRAGEITSSTTTLAADTVETITVTCNQCKATSIILCNVYGGGAAAGALSVNADPAAGSFTLKVRNNTAATAADAAYVVQFVIFDPVV